MALEFKWDGGKSKAVLLDVEYEEWESIESTLELFQEQTGLWLDPYSDTNISPKNAKILASMLEQIQKPKTAVRKLTSILLQAHRLDRWLVAIGD